MRDLTHIIFQNKFVETFEGDDSGDLSPRQTPGKLYSLALPTPVEKITLLGWSDSLSKQLEVNDLPVNASGDEIGAISVLGGNTVLPSMKPYAACYAGHQFGNWAGQLGDGRAITLGELPTSDGEIYELQLKGAGPTAYSRRADGRAVLRSSLREFIMSEAMYHLGVPTTRALSLVSTGDQVLRDMFYNGDARYEPGAIVSRVAPSFLRFGNFEVLAARGEIDKLQQLIDWTISRYFPHITGKRKMLDWYGEVVERTAKLIVEWLRVGFVHGVMNTDNMSVLGLTIDYGPYSFLDDYDKNFTPNTTDLPGRRYAFGNQASIAKWNLGCLGGALSPLFTDTDELVHVLETYDDVFWRSFYQMMGNKLGLDSVTTADISLITSLENILQAVQPDMTIFYQLLIHLPLTSPPNLTYFQPCFYTEDLAPQHGELFTDWTTKYVERRRKNTISETEAINKMTLANPRFILRNYLLHQAIEEVEMGSNELFAKLQKAIKEPYSKNFDEFFAKRPTWATQKAGCSMLSCSS